LSANRRFAAISSLALALVLPPAAGAVGMESGFQTPSRNIACEADLNPNGERQRIF